MNQTNRARIVETLKGVHDFYGKELTKFAVTVWLQACESFEAELVSKALSAHLMDPERGQFMPKPADLVRQLAGTKTDRSLLAWGKVLEAMRNHGAYASVAFDDVAIHAAIEDMGGWVRLCGATLDTLPFEQKRFCDTYRAYADRPDVPHLAVLPGIHAANNARLDHRIRPVLIGNPEKAKAIANGPSVSRTMFHVGDRLPSALIGSNAA